MGRSQETSHKKDVRNKKEIKRKEKEKKRLNRKENEKKGSLDDMIAYVDEYGIITSSPPNFNKKKEIKLEDIEISIPKQGAQKFKPLRQGKVTFFNESKGYGFIRDLETQQNIFVHINNILEEIKEDNIVTFEIVKGLKGPTAIHVKLIK